MQELLLLPVKTFLTSLQGPPNVQRPAAWSARARLNVWNQSSLSPTELRRETHKQSHLILLWTYSLESDRQLWTGEKE